MVSDKKKLPQNKSIPIKLRIQLWNALMLSTLTCALQTQELTTSQGNKLNSFAQKCMRGILDETWYKAKEKHEENKQATKQKQKTETDKHKTNPPQEQETI